MIDSCVHPIPNDGKSSSNDAQDYKDEKEDGKPLVFLAPQKLLIFHVRLLLSSAVYQSILPSKGAGVLLSMPSALEFSLDTSSPG